MSTAVTITLIICSTIIAIFLIALIANMITAKKTTKAAKDIMGKLFEEDE